MHSSFFAPTLEPKRVTSFARKEADESGAPSASAIEQETASSCLGLAVGLQSGSVQFSHFGEMSAGTVCLEALDLVRKDDSLYPMINSQSQTKKSSYAAKEESGEG